jgi:hypothetical protein
VKPAERPDDAAILLGIPASGVHRPLIFDTDE